MATVVVSRLVVRTHGNVTGEFITFTASIPIAQAPPLPQFSQKAVTLLLTLWTFGATIVSYNYLSVVQGTTISPVAVPDTKGFRQLLNQSYSFCSKIQDEVGIMKKIAQQYKNFEHNEHYAENDRLLLAAIERTQGKCSRKHQKVVIGKDEEINLLQTVAPKAEGKNMNILQNRFFKILMWYTINVPSADILVEGFRRSIDAGMLTYWEGRGEDFTWKFMSARVKRVYSKQSFDNENTVLVKLEDCMILEALVLYGFGIGISATVALFVVVRRKTLRFRERTRVVRLM